MDKFLIPWQSFGTSGPDNDNLLWQSGPLFVMDNHRLSLWCLGQMIAPNTHYRFFHLDAHYDCDPVLLTQDLPGPKELGLNEYRQHKHDGKATFRWDNYIPFFFQKFPHVDYKVSATHHIGLPAKFDKEIPPYNLLKETDDLLLYHKNWIVNLDFDYFYGRNNKDFLLFSDEFILEFFKLIKLNLDEGHILALTVALSPECCGGWEQSLKVLSLFEKIFCISISRPNP